MYADVLAYEADYEKAAWKAINASKRLGVVVYLDMCDRLPTTPWIVWVERTVSEATPAKGSVFGVRQSDIRDKCKREAFIPPV